MKPAIKLKNAISKTFHFCMQLNRKRQVFAFFTRSNFRYNSKKTYIFQKMQVWFYFHGKKDTIRLVFSIFLSKTIFLKSQVSALSTKNNIDD